jgi:hypothetical protein
VRSLHIAPQKRACGSRMPTSTVHKCCSRTRLSSALHGRSAGCRVSVRNHAYTGKNTYPTLTENLPMRSLMTCLALAALLAGCDSPTQPASLSPTLTPPDLLKEHVEEIVRQPVSDVIDNPCTGEVLTFTGEEMHVFNGVGPDVETGNFTNFTDFFKLSATGIGESGTQYVIHFAEQFTFESPTPESHQVSLTFRSANVLVSKGAGANFIAHFIIHITLTSNGHEVETTLDKAECRG